MTADAFAEPDNPKGLRCRGCGCRHFRVTSTDPKPNGEIKRYKICRACGKKAVTTERQDPETAS